MSNLTEQQIQALKNGAVGVTREGKKAKYIGQRHQDDEYAWIIYGNDNDDEIEVVINNYNEFQYYIGGEIDDENDIVGLWEDKPESFDLERALKGEPVKNKLSGSKGYVFQDPFNDNEVIVYWKTGLVSKINKNSNVTRIVMWKDPELQPQMVQLPKPLTKIVDKSVDVWFLDSSSQNYTPQKMPFDYLKDRYEYLANGLLYSSKEEVIQVIEATTGKPYQE